MLMLHFLLLFLPQLINSVKVQFLDSNTKILEFQQLYDVSIIHLTSSTSSNNNAFNKVAQIIRSSGIGFATVINSELPTPFIQNSTSTTNIAYGNDVKYPAPALIMQINFARDGALINKDGTEKQIIHFDITQFDQYKTKRKRMKEIFDFIYSEITPPVVHLPGIKPPTSESASLGYNSIITGFMSTAGKRARFVFDCVWPKIIVPYASPLSEEVKEMMLLLGEEYKGKLHVIAMDVNDNRTKQLVKDKLKVELTSGFKILFYDPFKQTWPKHYSVTNRLTFDAVKRWLGNNVAEHPNIIHHQLKKKKKTKKKKKKKKEL